MNWELVIAHAAGSGDNSIYRLRIPEGWLYRYGNALVFVPALGSVHTQPPNAVNPSIPSIFAPHVAKTIGNTAAGNTW